MTHDPDRKRTKGPDFDPVSAGLRKLWDGVEQEPIPPAFLDLLDQIDAKRGSPPGHDAPHGKRS